MAAKRKNGSDVEQPTPREKKKQKIAVARTIAVQSTASANESQNAVAGPSRIVTFDSKFSFCYGVDWMLYDFSGLKGLPSALDVEKFAEVFTIFS